MNSIVHQRLSHVLDKGTEAGLFERTFDEAGNQILSLPLSVRRAMDRAMVTLRAANPYASEDELRQRAALKVALAIVGRPDLVPAPLR